MLKFNAQNTDSIGADFGYTDEQMDEFSTKLKKFFESRSDAIRELDEQGATPTAQAEAFFAAFCEEFSSQDEQDLFLIQAIANVFHDALGNHMKAKIMEGGLEGLLDKLREMRDNGDDIEDAELEDLI